MNGVVRAWQELCAQCCGWGGLCVGGGEGKDRLGGVRCVGIEVCVCSVLWVCG